MSRLIKAALAAATITLATGCASNGWDALPTDDEATCVQVTEWESDGFTTKREALGTYCKQDAP